MLRGGRRQWGPSLLLVEQPSSGLEKLPPSCCFLTPFKAVATAANADIIVILLNFARFERYHLNLDPKSHGSAHVHSEGFPTVGLPSQQLRQLWKSPGAKVLAPIIRRAARKLPQMLPPHMCRRYMISSSLPFLPPGKLARFPPDIVNMNLGPDNRQCLRIPFFDAWVS